MNEKQRKVRQEVVNNTKKEAIMSLNLQADNGYSCEASYRVSPNQWARINEILNEKEQEK